jgi:dihydroorotate dehydrogenase
MQLGRAVTAMPFAWRPLSDRHRRQSQGAGVTIAGVDYANRMGVAAGLDKNAVALGLWAAMGFGHAEIGTVTPKPQPGNAKPRIFREPEQAALVNRMGFPNEGADRMAERLAYLQDHGRWPRMTVGVNVGKNKWTPNADAHLDYRYVVRQLEPFADYFTLNVSSPNTPNLRDLQSRDALERTVDAVRTAASGKPVWVKVAPDGSEAQVDALIAALQTVEIDGVVATNTTVSRPPALENAPSGGLSGRPLADLSMNWLKLLKSETSLPVASVGGIMTASDVRGRLEAGADLVQVYTGLVYHGPAWVASMNRESLAALRKG